MMVIGEKTEGQTLNLARRQGQDGIMDVLQSINPQKTENRNFGMLRVLVYNSHNQTYITI
jgi:hypothetical protein